MRHLHHRLSALLLAALVLLAAIPLTRAEGERPNPACRLGTFSGDMLVGGTQVLTDAGLFYVGEDDGYIYNLRSGSVPVVSEPAAKLNYADGVLYFARLHETCFDLVSFELASGKETVYLENFSGTPRQLYLVDGDRLEFLCDNIVWELRLSDGFFRMIRFAQDLWSFVPTGCGLIYATGTLFDYSLYADDCLLAEHVESYYVDFDLAEGALVYTQSGTDYQVDLASAFLGERNPVLFRGVAPVNVANDGTVTDQLTEEEVLQREAEAAEHADDGQQDILSQDGNQPPELDPPVDNTVPEQPETVSEPAAQDPQTAPVAEPEQETVPEATAEPEETPEAEPPAPEEMPEAEPPAPEETPEAEPPAPEETPEAEPPAPEETTDAPAPAQETKPEPEEKPEPEPTPAAPVTADPAQIINLPSVDAIYPPAEPEASGDQVRRPLTVGQQNTVKRAQQMLTVRWTPRKNITGWGGAFTYQAGVTYTGLPYGQAVNAAYVPWRASLTDFVDAVNDPTSLMYTSQSTYYKVAPYYSVDCSAFVSWAWDLPYRCSTRTIAAFGTLISSSSYANIQVGDMLNNAASHVVLVTDVTYDTDGSITGIEISQATPTTSYYGCCRSTWYTGSSGLARFFNSYLGSGYILYRNQTRENVSYTHECVVSLDGDECAVCGAGMLLQPGVDVNEHQGTIDWQTLSEHISFAIIRIGYHGSDGNLYLDKQYEANVQGCESNQIPYGVYFYSRATDAASAAAEGNFVKEKLQGHYPTLPVFMDVEDTKTILASSMTAAKLLTITKAFCSCLENTYQVGIYASESPWNKLMTDAAYNNWVRWVAKWPSSSGDTTDGVTLSLKATGGANVWQYGNNRLPGINALDSSGKPVAVDVDYWFGPVGSTDHRFTSSITSPTCSKAGKLTYRCVDCGQTASKTLGSFGHMFQNGSCKRCGRIETAFDHFTDLDENAWYAEAVSFVLDRGYFRGASDTIFAPSSPMTRAMMVTVLYRIAGEPEVEAVKLFDDVPLNTYYAAAVTWASNKGITKGTGNRVFSPNQTITREQAAVFLYRFAYLIGGMNTSRRGDLSVFPDAGEISSYARDAFSWAVALGILRGSSTETGLMLQPKSDASRAELAMLLMRFMQFRESR